MEEWKSYKLGDISTIQTGPFGSQLHQSDYVESGVPCIMPTNIGRMLDFQVAGIAHISEGDALKLSRHIVHEGDIVYSRRGDIEKCAYVSQEQDGWFCGTGCLKITINSNLAVPKFVAYYLSTDEIKSWIVGNAVGTTMLNLNTSVLADVPLSIPSIQMQKRCVQILDSIENKIALNNRINHNLEDCLFSLYIRLLENQCGLSTIGQVSERIYSGGTPDTKNSDFWGGAINWLSSGETSERFIIDTEKRITENGVRHSSTKYASKYDVVIASAGQGNTRGQTSMTLLNTCINQSVIVIHANSVEAPAIFCSLANRYDELRAISDASSIRGSLTTKMISALEIPIFPEVESVKFSSQAMCLIDQIENNLRENRSLKEQRDTLLPKLMGGELCK